MSPIGGVTELRGCGVTSPLCRFATPLLVLSRAQFGAGLIDIRPNRPRQPRLHEGQ